MLFPPFVFPSSLPPALPPATNGAMLSRRAETTRHQCGCQNHMRYTLFTARRHAGASSSPRARAHVLAFACSRTPDSASAAPRHARRIYGSEGRRRSSGRSVRAAIKQAQSCVKRQPCKKRKAMPMPATAMERKKGRRHSERCRAWPCCSIDRQRQR